MVGVHELDERPILAIEVLINLGPVGTEPIDYRADSLNIKHVGSLLSISTERIQLKSSAAGGA
jgi:hypothetical protein